MAVKRSMAGGARATFAHPTLAPCVTQDQENCVQLTDHTKDCTGLISSSILGLRPGRQPIAPKWPSHRTCTTPRETQT